MYEKLYIEQPQVIKQLDNMIKKGRVPHALIFYGDESTSKLDVAKLFIKMLYAKYLGTELSEYAQNELIDKEIHPNCKFIRRDNKTTITIDTAREIINDSSMLNDILGPSIYTFVDADYFNQSSINSILKFVEEPKDDTFIIFIVNNLSSLLPTIISRSIVINFKPLDKYQVRNNLIEEGLDKDFVNVLTEYRQGEDEVKELYNSKDYIDVYEFIKDLINEQIENNGSFVLAYQEKSNLLRDNKLQDFFLSLLVYLIDDMLKIKTENNNLVFFFLEDRIKKLSSLYSDIKLREYYKKLLELKYYVSSRKQVNFNLYLNNLLLDMELVIGNKR